MDLFFSGSLCRAVLTASEQITQRNSLLPLEGIHDPRSLEGHLQRPRLAQRVGSFTQVGHKEHFLLACLDQTTCSCSRIDPRCELALQIHLKTLISPSCQVLHPHPSSSSRGMISTCCNRTHQLLLFPPLFAAGSGSHALFSTSRFAELLQAEKLFPTHHITALSTPKVFLQIEAQSFFCNIHLRLGLVLTLGKLRHDRVKPLSPRVFDRVTAAAASDLTNFLPHNLAFSFLLQVILLSSILCILSHLTPRIYELYEAKNKRGLMCSMSVSKVSLQVFS